MTDKNLMDLTNEDIISSLEVIATTCNCNECKIRSGKWGTCNCSETTANAALDLIKCQKIEIERLQKEVNLVSIQFQDLQERYEEAQAEIEKLKKEVEDKERAYSDEFCLRKEWKNKCQELLQEKQITKAEAYKEFAERLKEMATQRFWETDAYVGAEQIDNLVKEMAGENNDL